MATQSKQPCWVSRQQENRHRYIGLRAAPEIYQLPPDELMNRTRCARVCSMSVDVCFAIKREYSIAKSR